MRLLAYLLGIVMLLHAVVGVTASIALQLKRQVIAERLCENLSRPAMRCHGKCFMKKRLAAAEKARQAESERSAAMAFAFVALTPTALFELPMFSLESSLVDERSAIVGEDARLRAGLGQAPWHPPRG